MKRYKIPVYWEVFGYISIEADSLEEAIEKYDQEEEYFDLPDKQYYVDGSFNRETDIDMIKTLNRIKD